MTIVQARKLLPPFAIGLGMCCCSVAQLRRAVNSEIYWAELGENPLDPKQIDALRKFLKRIEAIND